MTFESVNPATGERLQSFETISDARLDEALEAARETFRELRRTGFEERSERLRRCADLLERGAGAYGRLMSTEMGKTLGQAEAEVEKCAWVCRHYAERGPELLAEEPVETEAARSAVRYEPLGPILAVMPWNFPFWQVFRFAAPALMAGNTALLKHAPNVPQCALAIEGIVRRAGFPEGALQNLFLETGRVAEVIADPRIRGVTLTGSVGAGRAVAEEAGRHVKKTVLELGGSDPFIVMPSADLRPAVETAVRARIQNSGQSCIAGKRFLVADEVADEFRKRFVERMSALTVGDPLQDGTDVGPLAREDLVERLERQVEESVAAGASVLLGGGRLERPGFFYGPTVLGDVPDGSPAAREELFGPVASLFRVGGVEEAIERANETEYGLGAAAWTRDDEERERFVSDLEAGAVTINGMVSSDPRLPFGGVKASGYGRELGEQGIREFVNVKSVEIREY